MDEHKIRRKILELLRERGPSKSICPSEVARSLRDNDWQDLMDSVRTVAARLQEKELLSVTQGNQTGLNPQTADGPIRLRLRNDSS